MSEYRGFRDLIVYQKSYSLASEIFKISKIFPKEEGYVLVDQIRRSSRSFSYLLPTTYYILDKFPTLTLSTHPQ
jgi:hypothetical protein